MVAALVVAVAMLCPACSGDTPRPRPGELGGYSARPRIPVHPAAKPRILPRSAWEGKGAPGQPPPHYDARVVGVFIHHTDTPNGYDCADTPRIIRGIYADQARGRSWDDIGYNFLVDRCGTVYEGRSGGIERPVVGAHTQGFNHRTAGIAAIGTFTAGVKVPPTLTEAIAALVAWKLGLSDTDPRGTVRLVSTSSESRFKSGTTAVLPVVAGHNEGYQTSCPGVALTAMLPAIRGRAALLQGRQ